MQTSRLYSSQQKDSTSTKINHTLKKLIINQYIPSGFCINSTFAYRDVKDPLKLYRGENCVQVFCNYIENEAKRLYHMFPKKPMNSLTHDELRKFNKATKCHICFKKFQELNPKVRDHCHYTGQYPWGGTSI